MKARWRLELATSSNSSWFVGIETWRVSVLAPPGVPVNHCAEADSFPKRRTGWRWGVWDRDGSDHWPVLDDEPPRAVREVSTRDVLQILGSELHELVWTCLWNQLQVARRIGIQRLDAVPSEDLARAGALSTAWLSTELESAFPDRTVLLEPYPCDLALEATEVPEDPAELVRPSPNGPAGGWLARWLLARRAEAARTERSPEWRVGDPLDGTGHGIDPGDLSAYSWGEEPGSEYDIDLASDAEPLGSRVEEGSLPAGSGST